METFPFSVHWQGSTSTTTYSRNGIVRSDGKPDILVSAAPKLGDAARWNPEDMLGASLANCQMLTFLALAAKAGLDVRAYDDKAEAIMEMKDGKTRVTTIKVSPTVRVAGAFDQAKAHELFDKAHKYCIIANSILCEVVMQPTFVAA